MDVDAGHQIEIPLPVDARVGAQTLMRLVFADSARIYADGPDDAGV
jgi:hypothetical protein